MENYKYYVETCKGKFYFDIDAEYGVVFDIENYKETMNLIYYMVDEKDASSWFKITQNFLKVYSGGCNYGYPEYIIFETKTNQLAELN